jgi:hypothetical protein
LNIEHSFLIDGALIIERARKAISGTPLLAQGVKDITLVAAWLCLPSDDLAGSTEFEQGRRVSRDRAVAPAMGNREKLKSTAHKPSLSVPDPSRVGWLLSLPVTFSHSLSKLHDRTRQA